MLLEAFLDDLVDEAFTFESAEADLPRIRQLVTRYADLPLGLADTSVVACAERCDAGILTFDRRDFAVVAREGRVRLVP